MVVFDVRSRGQVVDETQTLISALLKCTQILACIKCDNHAFRTLTFLSPASHLFCVKTLQNVGLRLHPRASVTVHVYLLGVPYSIGEKSLAMSTFSSITIPPIPPFNPRKNKMDAKDADKSLSAKEKFIKRQKPHKNHTAINEHVKAMRQKFESGEDSDVTLRAEDGTIFKLHKVIITGQSKFFKKACHPEHFKVSTSYSVYHAGPAIHVPPCHD